MTDEQDKCRFCGRLKPHRCRSTRDMSPIDGLNTDPKCHAALADLGGGERQEKLKPTSANQ